MTILRGLFRPLAKTEIPKPGGRLIDPAGGTTRVAAAEGLLEGSGVGALAVGLRAGVTPLMVETGAIVAGTAVAAVVRDDPGC